MGEHRTVNKPIAAVVIALLLVLLIVVVVFVSGESDGQRMEIVLPDNAEEESLTQQEIIPSSSGLLQITEDNAVNALTSLTRPDYYHQRYRVRLGDGSNPIEVELWINGELKRAEISTQRWKKVILNSGSDFWVWYANSNEAFHFPSKDTYTFEDLIGLPAFDYLSTLRDVALDEAEYLVLESEQGEKQCIFVSVRDENDGVDRYWIDLENGLLHLADRMENSKQIYQVEQITFDLLAQADEEFQDRFVLPDGTSISKEGT